MEVFGSSGTRGVANEDLTPAFVLRVARAAATVWDVDRIAIARDTRQTGRMLADAAASGIASTGADVERIGIVPTPAAQLFAEREGVPAIVITASHNPPEYNGMKLIGADGVELGVSSLETIEETLLAESFAVAPWDETGQTTRTEDLVRQYRDALLGAIDGDRIAGADLTVAVDPGHGAGSLTSPRLIRDLGCRVVTVNAQPDGTFPGRDPEPIADNLTDLRRLVEAADADVGIAHDGDADRAIFVDETGAHIEGDAAFAALAAAELDTGDTLVTAVNVSQRLVDIVDEVGATLELTPIGSTHIITRIQEVLDAGETVPIAGEGNGGIFFPEHRLARDGGYIAARFLELVAETPASELVAPYDGYVNERRNLSYGSTAERDAMLDAVATMARESEAELNMRDGYRLDFGDAWVLARPSGTEPLIRIYAEARDRDRAAELTTSLAGTMESSGS